MNCPECKHMVTDAGWCFNCHGYTLRQRMNITTSKDVYSPPMTGPIGQMLCDQTELTAARDEISRLRGLIVKLWSSNKIKAAVMQSPVVSPLDFEAIEQIVKEERGEK